jgi:1,4-alpha-glucan branching enzyme
VLQKRVFPFAESDDPDIILAGALPVGKVANKSQPSFRGKKAMIKKEPMEKEGRVLVTFKLPSSMWAERVNLVGEFNDWDTIAMPMVRSRGDDDWKATIELEAGRRYRFRYLIDGKEWLNDWHADDYVENPYGSNDSVVDLT